MEDLSLLGTVSEVVCPDLSGIMTNYKALGMIGSAELFNGFDKMEASIKWTFPANEVKLLCANFLYSVNLMVRSSRAEYINSSISAEKPVVIYLRGRPKKHQAARSNPSRTPNWRPHSPLTITRKRLAGWI